ncbi:MAG: DUF2252 family protein, partial [Dermatophilaceae bacterium]
KRKPCSQDMSVTYYRSSESYETWMASQINVNVKELDDKHKQMATDSFTFLRATFYDWAHRFPVLCPQIAGVPAVLGVGDLHIENFGLWRDAEARLVWGINDFDEASYLPYTNDLVRLLTSAVLTLEDVDLQEAGAALADGYATNLATPGRPFVLAEDHQRLGELALSQIGAADGFWKKMAKLDSYPDLAGTPKDLLLASMPDHVTNPRICHRQAGLGSLGRTRATSIAEWRGGLIAREVKQVLPSAWAWANTGDDRPTIMSGAILDRAVRCPDPFLQVRQEWVVRRLAPDCKRIELDHLRNSRKKLRLLAAMGAELANVHLGTPQASDHVLDDLMRRPSTWLTDAASTMGTDVKARHKVWADSLDDSP